MVARGLEFGTQHRILDEYFFTFIFCKNCIVIRTGQI